LYFLRRSATAIPSGQNVGDSTGLRDASVRHESISWRKFMPKFCYPKVGSFPRSKGSLLGFSMLAWFITSSLAWGQVQPFTLTPLLAHGTPGATTISINHKVVVNQYGMFVAYLQNTSETKTQWRLARSVDHGASFTVIDASPDVSAPNADSTHVPLLETDSAGNVYMIRAGNFHSEADAYMRKYSPTYNFAPPATESPLQSGSAQKCSMMIDEARGQLYFISETMRSNPTRTELWFYVMGLDGTLRRQAHLAYSTDSNLRPAWPHVTMDEQGDVYVAWTNIKGTTSETYQHYSTHVMRSVNGGSSWQKLTGQSVSEPVISDPASNHPNSIPMINDPAELGASMELWTMRVKEGKIHLAYQHRGETVTQRYLRYDTVTGQKDRHTTSWAGETMHLNSLDGFCTASNAADHTVYCVGGRAADGSPTTASNRLAVLASYDNGQTWHDFATTGDLGKYAYGVTGAREVKDGHIIGMFTLLSHGNDPAANAPQNVVQFFRIPVTANTPTMQRLHTVNVTTNAAAAGYPAANAIDGNPQTLWTASTTLDVANNNAWIQIDLGANKQIDRVRWLSGIGTPFPSYCPAHYTISVSQDNVNWTTVHTRTLGPGNIQSSEPMGGVTARYVKMTTTKVNDGNGWSLSFYEFWAEGTAMPPTRLPVTTGGAQTPGYETSKANDGLYNTQFVHSLSMVPQNNVAAFKLSFGTYRQVARVKWVAGVGYPSTASAPRDFVIQVSNDDINWTTVASRWAPNLAGSTWEGSIPINVSTQHVRILTSAIFDESGYALSFLEFWAEGW
jgi:hypothetical protein